LVAGCFPVVAASAQRAEVLAGVGVGVALGDELASTDRVVVGDVGEAGAEGAVRVLFEVVEPAAPPGGAVSAFGGGFDA